MPIGEKWILSNSLFLHMASRTMEILKSVSIYLRYVKISMQGTWITIKFLVYKKYSKKKYKKFLVYKSINQSV